MVKFIQTQWLNILVIIWCFILYGKNVQIEKSYTNYLQKRETEYQVTIDSLSIAIDQNRRERVLLVAQLDSINNHNTLLTKKRKELENSLLQKQQELKDKKTIINELHKNINHPDSVVRELELERYVQEFFIKLESIKLD